MRTSPQMIIIHVSSMVYIRMSYQACFHHHKILVLYSAKDHIYLESQIIIKISPL